MLGRVDTVIIRTPSFGNGGRRDREVENDLYMSRSFDVNIKTVCIKPSV